MTFQLDDIDIAMLESLVKDGRKSFRQISLAISSRAIKFMRLAKTYQSRYSAITANEEFTKSQAF